MKTSKTSHFKIPKILLTSIAFTLISISCFALELSSNDCDNLTDGGEIAQDQSICNPGDIPELFENVTFPFGGSGEVEYIWIYTTDDPNSNIANWIPIPGSTEDHYQAGPIFENTWFRRCARNSGCTDYVVESNWVMICVDTEVPNFTYVPVHYEANCNDFIEFGEPAYKDDCDADVTLTYEDFFSQEGCLTNNIRTWTLTDACGKEAFANQVITTIDTEAPTITMNDPYTDISNGDVIYFSCSDAPSFDETSVNVTDNCDEEVDVTFVDNLFESGNCAEDGYIEIYECTWTATDNCGNVSSFTVYIHIVDDEDPYFTYVPENLEIPCDEDPVFGEPEYADNCDLDIDVSLELTSETDECTTTYITTWTIMDECGNHATASQTITSIDLEAPQVSLNAPLDNVQNGDTLYYECEMAFALSENDVTVLDNCDDDPQVTFTDDWYPSDDCIEDGYLEKMKCYWIATDDCGNESIFLIYIFIIDETAPHFTYIPESINIECDEDAAFGEPLYEDNCGSNVQLTEEIISEEFDCEYSQTIIWTITDDCGNQNNASQTINYIDTAPPTMKLRGPGGEIENGSELSYSCEEGYNFDENSITVSDICDDNITVTFYSDAVASANCMMDGYLFYYTYTWLAVDDCGNESFFEINVKVIDLSPPTIIYTPEDQTIECHSDPIFGEAEFVDNCDGDLDIQIDDFIEEDTCTIFHTRIWTATDDCGNFISTSQTITTEDSEAPEIQLGGEYADVMDGDTLWFDCGNIYYFNEDDAIATDNCDEQPTIIFEDDFIDSENCYEDGYLAKAYCTWTATDDCGNESSISIYVYIHDEEAPIFTFVPEDLNLDCNADPELTGEPVFEDNCDTDLEVDYEMKIIGDGCELKYIRVWIVTDDCGNSARASQVIYTNDNAAPIIATLNPVTGTDCNNFTVIDPIVEDDCDPSPTITVDIDTIYGPEYVDLKINWTVIDYCGNEAYAYQAVTVPCHDGFNFTDIEANRIGRDEVNISWAVANDQDGNQYVIETSADGVNFVTENTIIPTFGAAYMGNNQYTFSIDDNYSGRSYYRVRYIETDGSATLSDIDELIEFNVQTQALIYPNPVINLATIELLNPLDARSTVKVFDMRGLLLKEIIPSSDDLQIPVDFQELEAGIYFIHYQINGLNYVQRFVKVDE